MARFGVNILSGDSTREDSYNQPNLSSSDMSSKIYPKNVIMATLEEIPWEQRKVFEVHR
jgi:hypothetical protein